MCSQHDLSVEVDLMGEEAASIFSIGKTNTKNQPQKNEVQTKSEECKNFNMARLVEAIEKKHRSFDDPQPVKPPVNDTENNVECKNCKEILAFTAECEICNNPLQNTFVNSCVRCGGLWCGRCARRLMKCPFCRTPAPQRHNAALAKMIKRLTLPCRNHRLGCTVTVTAASRYAHESICQFGQLLCPLAEACGLVTNTEELFRHLEIKHDLRTMKTSHVNISVERLREKLVLSLMTLAKFKICLMAYNNLFVIKLTFFNSEMELTIKRFPITSEVDLSYSKIERVLFMAKVDFVSKHFSIHHDVEVRKLVASRVSLLTKNMYPFQSLKPTDDVNVLLTVESIADHGRIKLTV